MHNARVSVATAADGSLLVHAIFDLTEAEVAGAAHAVNSARTEQFRHEVLTADGVLAMRELTAVADELTALVVHRSACTLTLRPARLVAMRDALDAFVVRRDDAGFVREEDRDAYASAQALAAPLADLGADAVRAALDGAAPAEC